MGLKSLYDVQGWICLKGATTPAFHKEEPIAQSRYSKGRRLLQGRGFILVDRTPLERRCFAWPYHSLTSYIGTHLCVFHTCATLPKLLLWYIQRLALSSQRSTDRKLDV